MAVVGKLIAVLTARTAPFQKGLKGAVRTTRRFGSAIAGISKRLVQFGVIAAAAAVTGVVLLSRQQAKQIDIIAKWSQLLNISTEALSSLAFVAEQSGVDFKVLTLGLQRMTRRIGEAAEETGEAQGALKQLGIDAKEFNKLAPDEVLKRLAEKLKEAGLRGTQLVRAFKLLDSEGVALLRVLDLGRAGIEELQAVAGELNLTFTEFDARKVEEMNNAINRLKGAFQGLARQLVIQLAPVITIIANELVNLISNTGAFGRAVGQTFQSIVGTLGTVLDAFNAMNVASIRLEATLARLRGSFLVTDPEAAKFFIQAAEELSKVADKLAADKPSTALDKFIERIRVQIAELEQKIRDSLTGVNVPAGLDISGLGGAGGGGTNQFRQVRSLKRVIAGDGVGKTLLQQRREEVEEARRQRAEQLIQLRGINKRLGGRIPVTVEWEDN